MRAQHTITAETQEAAKQLTGEILPIGAAITITAPKSSTPRDCLCGCGGQTSGGLGVPGHDAKHKSRLFAIARGQLGDEQAAAAKAELAQRGWGLPSGRKQAQVAPLPIPTKKA